MAKSRRPFRSLRSSIETEPTDFTNIQSLLWWPQNGIDAFVKEKPLAVPITDLTLNDGIKLLEGAKPIPIRRR